MQLATIFGSQVMLTYLPGSPWRSGSPEACMVTDGLTLISVCNFAESVFPGQRCVLGNGVLEALQALEAEFFFFFWPCYEACGILVPHLGIKPVPPALEAWSLNHWAPREAPGRRILNSALSSWRNFSILASEYQLIHLSSDFFPQLLELSRIGGAWNNVIGSQ